MRIGADHRSRDVHPYPDANKDLDRARRLITEGEALAARTLATIKKRRSYIEDGFKSPQAQAESRGYGPAQANRLLALGCALAEQPQLDRRFRVARRAGRAWRRSARCSASPSWT